MSAYLKFECQKFSANIFNQTKCQHCFRPKDSHSAEALEGNRASRKISKCGYLFVAPDWDFTNPLNRTKRWQRRWFVLYDDGELTYSVDEHPETVPQGTVDISKVIEVSDAEEVTGNKYSVAITTAEKVYFVKGTCKEESKWWFDVLSVFARSKLRHKRNATFPGIKGSSVARSPLSISALNQSGDSLKLRNNKTIIETSPKDKPLAVDVDNECDAFHSPPLPQLVPAALSVSSHSSENVCVQNSSEAIPASSIAQPGLSILVTDYKSDRAKRISNQHRNFRHDTSKSNGVHRSHSIGAPGLSNQHSSPLYVRVSDASKIMRFESLDSSTIEHNIIHLSRDKSRIVEDEISNDKPNVPTNWNCATCITSERGVSDGMVKEHTVRGDPDGCGLDTLRCPSSADSKLEEPFTMKKGWLMKQDPAKEWIKRWFVLFGSSLVQYKDSSAEDANISEEIISLNLVQQIHEVDVGRNYGFKIILCSGQCHLLSALTLGLRNSWIQAIQSAAFIHASRGNFLTSSLLNENNEQGLASHISGTDAQLYRNDSSILGRTVLGSAVTYNTCIDNTVRTSNLSVNEKSGNENASSSRTLPPSPPLNRTAISRVKERARHKGNLRPARPSLGSADGMHPGEGVQSFIGDDVDDKPSSDDKLKSSFRTRDPARRHTLPSRKSSIPSVEDSKMSWMSSKDAKKSDETDGGSNSQMDKKDFESQSTQKFNLRVTDVDGHMYEQNELPKKEYLLNRRNISLSCTDRNKLLNFGENVENPKTNMLDSKFGLIKPSLSSVCEKFDRNNASTVVTRINRVAELEDNVKDFDSTSMNSKELQDKCSRLKGKLSVAVNEIKTLQTELRKTQIDGDILELRCVRQERDASVAESQYRSEVSLLSLRIQDLATKLYIAERQLKQLRQKSNLGSPVAGGKAETERRRTRSLKGREALTVSKEIEVKVHELENRLKLVEGTFTPVNEPSINVTHTVQNADTNSSGNCNMDSTDLKVQPVPSSSSSPSSVLESLALHSRLKSIDERLNHAVEKIKLDNEMNNFNHPEVNIELCSPDAKEYEKMQVLPMRLNDFILQLQGLQNKCICNVGEELKRTLVDFQSSWYHPSEKLTRVTNYTSLNTILSLLKESLYDAKGFLEPVNNNSEFGAVTQPFVEYYIKEVSTVIKCVDLFSNSNRVQVMAEEIKEGLLLMSQIESDYCVTFQLNIEDNHNTVNFINIIDSYKWQEMQQSQLISLSHHVDSKEKDCTLKFNEFLTCKVSIMANYIEKDVRDFLKSENMKFSTDEVCQAVKSHPVVQRVLVSVGHVLATILAEAELSFIIINLTKKENDFSETAKLLLEILIMKTKTKIEIINAETRNFLHLLTDQILMKVNSNKQALLSKAYIEEETEHILTLIDIKTQLIGCIKYVKLLLKNLPDASNGGISHNINYYEEMRKIHVENIPSFVDTKVHLSILNNLLQSLINPSIFRDEKYLVVEKVDEKLLRKSNCFECEKMNNSMKSLIGEHDELKHQNELQKQRIVSMVVENKQSLSAKDNLHKIAIQQVNENMENLQLKLKSIEDEYAQDIAALKKTFEQEIAHRNDVRLGGTTVHQKYQMEIEQIRDLCEKAMIAMEHSHKRLLVELEEKHRREIERVYADKDQALAEETQATLAALDAMRKAHETELQREVAKFKEEYLVKMESECDLDALHREQEKEMKFIQHEIISLSDKYTKKCLEGVTLEEQVENLAQKLDDAQSIIFDLTARNKQLRSHLKQNIRELQNLTKNVGNSGQKLGIKELQLQLQLKEGQLTETVQQIADLERQLNEAKNYQKSLEQHCQVLDANVRSNSKALGDEVNGLRARLEQIIQLSSQASQEGESEINFQEESYLCNNLQSCQLRPCKPSMAFTVDHNREMLQLPGISGLNYESSPKSSHKTCISPTVQLEGVVASRKRLFEYADRR